MIMPSLFDRARHGIDKLTARFGNDLTRTDIATLCMVTSMSTMCDALEEPAILEMIARPGPRAEFVSGMRALVDELLPPRRPH